LCLLKLLCGGVLCLSIGPLKSAPLSEFLEEYAGPKKASSDKDSKKKDKPAKPAEPEVPCNSFLFHPFISSRDSLLLIFFSVDPIVFEIKDQKGLDEQCIEKAGVCVLSLLTLESEFEESVKAHAADVEILTKVRNEEQTTFSFLIILFRWNFNIYNYFCFIFLVEKEIPRQEIALQFRTSQRPLYRKDAPKAI
jgi:hypothetical protein